MTPVVLAAGLVALPIVVLTLLKSNAATVFLSLALGSLLERLIGGVSSPLLSHVAAQHHVDSTAFVPLALLLLPPIFTTLITIGTVKKKPRLAIDILPAAAVGVVGLLLAVPLLPASAQATLTHTGIWQQIKAWQIAAVGAGSAISLLFLWLQRPKRKPAEEDGGKGKKKHKH